MNFVLLLTDGNTVSTFGWNVITEFTGGDWIFIGIIVMAILALVLLLGQVKSGGAVVIGAAFMFLLSLFNSVFIFAFWLALIIGLFLLVNGIRKQIMGTS
ncbi:MAG: hypothetical protein H7836_10760 [Magnetococcus sp. YQC-3]